MHILYLEDSELDARFVRQYMDSVPHKFVTVKKINDAWQYLQQNQVDIFLVDIIIGNELAYGLVANRLAGNVIAVTAKALPAEQQYYRELGCTSVITKPFTIDDLEQTINQYIA
jgi:CheY-like chemotaxis protein